jgi:TRAP-type C4-dicarboxylate transport system substrate-binding protein
MKKKVGLICAVFALLVLFGVREAAAQASKETVIKLKVADMTPASSDTGQILEWWSSEVEKATNGRVKVERYFAGSLVGAYEQLSSVKTGIIHVTPYYSGYHPDLAPLPLIGLMPMMHRGTIKQAVYASDEFCKTVPAIQAEFQKNNVKYLFQNFNAFNYMYSKAPINTLNDLKGKTIRAYGPYLTFFKEFGVGVVSLPVPEVYEALDRGAVDGTIQYLANAMGARYFEIVKHVNVTELGHNVGCPAVMHLGTWNKLPRDIQAIIEGINKKAADQAVAISEASRDRDMNLVKGKGMTINSFSKEEVDKMIEVAQAKVWTPYAQALDKKGLPGTKVLQEYIRIVEKYGKK